MIHSTPTPSENPSFFFAARLQDRRSSLLVTEIDALRRAMRTMKAQYATDIDAIAVLPNQILTIWTLPRGDINYADRWALLKSGFSAGVQSESGHWQPHFDAHLLGGPSDIALYRHKIMAAPCDYGLVNRPQDWPYSSIHRDGYDKLVVAEMADPERTWPEELALG